MTLLKIETSYKEKAFITSITNPVTVVLLITCLVCEGEADSLPSLDSDGDNEEDGGRQGKVARTLQNGKHEPDVLHITVLFILQQHTVDVDDDNNFNRC